MFVTFIRHFLGARMTNIASLKIEFYHFRSCTVLRSFVSMYVSLELYFSVHSYYDVDDGAEAFLGKRARVINYHNSVVRR